MNERKNISPIPISLLKEVPTSTGGDDSDWVVASINEAIERTNKSPEHSLILHGLSTDKVVIVPASAYSKACVEEVEDRFRQAGYATVAIGSPTEYSTLVVCWDDRLLPIPFDPLSAPEQDDDVQELFGFESSPPSPVFYPEEHIPSQTSAVFPGFFDVGSNPEELTPYIPVCKDIVRVAGLSSKAQLSWNKKCCMAYIAAACLLSQERAKYRPKEEMAKLPVTFPPQVPATAVASAVRELHARFYHAVTDTKNLLRVDVCYQDEARRKYFGKRDGFSLEAYPLTDMLRPGSIAPSKVIQVQA